ncbi:MAG: hypothetical protein IPP32_08850 [Bacteroidetes bacterium]|nr:hypothetical protein [Bacteroidota bacterium]
MNHQQLYEELGKLLYAISNADGEIHDKEISSVHSIVMKDFVPYEEQTDKAGINDAFYTEFEVEALTEEDADVENAFASFIDFLKKNAKEVNPTLKLSVMAAAQHVAESYKGINRVEKYYLTKLKQELDSI